MLTNANIYTYFQIRLISVWKIKDIFFVFELFSEL